LGAGSDPKRLWYLYEKRTDWGTHAFVQINTTVQIKKVFCMGILNDIKIFHLTVFKIT
jgi:hypothetical protein